MTRTEQPAAVPQRVEDPRPSEEQRVHVARKERVPTRFVDPYDMQTDPQPEEPGYGHGV